jgi:hypothetical protein
MRSVVYGILDTVPVMSQCVRTVGLAKTVGYRERRFHPYLLMCRMQRMRT